MGMLKVIFDFSFDRGCWPGPLQHQDAAAGEIWVGPSGCLDIIETFTGLRAPVVPHFLRVASIIDCMSRINGFWDASAQVDPFGCAKKILEWRDYLWLYGWQGHSCTPRINELAKVTQDVLPGVPDRLANAEKAIPSAGNVISELVITEPLSVFPCRWRKVIQALDHAGTNIIQPGTAAPQNQRAAPGSERFMQLLRPSSWADAAWETAAWLSMQGDLKNTVIIGPDMVLDEALYRFGLPTTGAGLPVYDNALLQILPLVLEMARRPPDPQRALELLMLPISPVPRFMAQKLIKALQDYPAVGSDAWQAAIEDGLAVIEDTNQREQLKNRIEFLFSASLSSNIYPASQILERIDIIRTWSRGKMSQDHDQLDWHPLVAQLENFRQMINLTRLNHFTAPQIRHMLSDISDELPSPSLYDNQAGIAHVGAPECIYGKADTIIWWSFNKEAAAEVFMDPFTDSEKKALENLDVTLPTPADQAVRLAHIWQRPVPAALKQLILVCPKTDAAGERQFPHPLWDEIMDQEQEHETITAAGKPVLVERVPIPLPAPVNSLNIPRGSVCRRQRESPSSLSLLLSCPFRWVLSYPGKISGGLIPGLSAPEELEGWFIHELLARVLKKGRQSPYEAGQTVCRIFDREGPFLAAAYFLPGRDSLREKVRSATKMAAEQLFHIINKGKFTIDSVETSLDLDISSMDITLTGRPDLVLTSPMAVIDFKRGGVGYRQDELASGTSVQLAVYSRLLADRNNNTFPASAYFMVKAGQLITCDSKIFPMSVPVDGISSSKTWQAVKTTYLKIWQEQLDQGIVSVPGNDDPPIESSELTGDQIVLAPCAFCDYGVLCGNAFMGGEI